MDLRARFFVNHTFELELFILGSRQSTPGDVEERLNGRGDGRRFRGSRERGGPPPSRGRGGRGGRGDQEFRRQRRDDDETVTEESTFENK